MPNLARHVFLHPNTAAVYADWVAAADQRVDRLRATTTRWGDDHEFAALLDELRTTPEFNDNPFDVCDDGEAPWHDTHRAPGHRPTAPQLRGAP